MIFDKKNNNKSKEDSVKEITESSNSSKDLTYENFYKVMTSATNAELEGERLSAVYLYLSAYEYAKKVDDEALKNAVLGLKNAWSIVVDIKNRPLAEAIFEILVKHLSEDEIEVYSNDLHDIMVEKLSNLGFPTDALANSEHTNETINTIKDFFGQMNKPIESNGLPVVNKNTNSSSKKELGKEIAKQINKAIDSKNDNSENISTSRVDKNTHIINKEIVKYENLVGYDSAIDFMRKKGLGADSNSQYNQLIARLNKEHGLDRITFSKTIVFKSDSREDAKEFMEATAAEVNMPVIHMHMDESISGASVLCMMASADTNFRLNPGRTGFTGKGILVLEDFDLWDFPDIENNPNPEDLASLMSMQMSKGVFEVINLIEIALEDPNILVMGSMANNSDSEGPLSKMILENCDFVDVLLPNDSERASIWAKMQKDHPSLRAFSIQKLVNYSKNMSRYDIKLAVHEALEDAYKKGIEKRQYIPLSILNIIEKLAEHQPVDSTEYKTLEDAATADFVRELDHIDDILK